LPDWLENPANVYQIRKIAVQEAAGKDCYPRLRAVYIQPVRSGRCFVTSMTIGDGKRAEKTWSIASNARYYIDLDVARNTDPYRLR
jgi:hypothetical protein